MRMFKNSEEFLEAMECPDYWNEYAKMLYQSVSCKPWARRLIVRSPQQLKVETAHLEKQGTGVSFCPGQNLSVDFLAFLGELGPTWKQYCRNVRDYIAAQRATNSPDQPTLSVERWARGISITRSFMAKAIVDVMPDIADVGAKFDGIEIGSIIEGSDVEVGPRRLFFPFTDEELEQVIRDTDAEATFYWKRDNTDLYMLYRDDGSHGPVAMMSRTAFEKPIWTLMTERKRGLTKTVKANALKCLQEWSPRYFTAEARAFHTDTQGHVWSIKQIIDESTWK